MWIELKATREPWTVSQLLEDNLLANFLCNAAVSEHAGRAWDVRLVTEAEVRGDEVRAFLAGPTRHSRHVAKLRAALDTAYKRLREQGMLPPDGFDLRATADKLLRRLATSEPAPFRALKAEVEAELALACPERAGRAKLASALVGAMILDAGAGPAAARAYILPRRGSQHPRRLPRERPLRPRPGFGGRPGAARRADAGPGLVRRSAPAGLGGDARGPPAARRGRDRRGR